MVFFRNVTVTSLLLAQLAGHGLSSLSNPALAHWPDVPVSQQNERLKELKDKLRIYFADTISIDSLFNDPNFQLEMEIFDRTKVNPESEVASGSKDYKWYREVLQIDKKIKEAPNFMRKYTDELRSAENKHGVDKRFIVGVLGIESGFKEGSKIGKYMAFNALATLYVVTPKKEYAYRELKELVIFSSRTGIPIFSFNSSYAGAIGCAQFIPSSLNRLFIGKYGKVEKSNPTNMTDCIHSVAYYLKSAGWKNSENGKIHEKSSRNWKAIYSYNKSEPYVKAVIEIATSLK